MKGARPEHLTARFRARLPPGGAPRRFGIVTAWNPGSRPAPRADNLRADRRLRRVLAREGLACFRVTGGSPDFSHAEPGWGIAARSAEEIRRVSRLFRQEAFYWVDGDAVWLLPTEGRGRRRAGSWREKSAR